MSNLKEMEERYAVLARELEDKTKAIQGEKRTPSDEEREWSGTIIAEMDDLDKQIERERDQDKIERAIERAKESRTRIVRPNPLNITGDKKGFRSLGEFLQAVYVAGVSPRVDSRLSYQPIETRAATGMSEGIPADGGFLVQTDIAEELFKLAHETGRLASKCRSVPISGNSNSMKINAIAETSRVAGSRWGGIRAYWLNEAGTKTSSAPKFRQIELNLHKLIGLAYATDELLQDSAALESVIRQGFGEEFGFQLDDAILNGTGAGMPLGILNSGSLVTATKDSGQTATTFTATNAINMWARLLSPAKPNSVWLINGDVTPQLMQMYLGVTSGMTYVYVPPGGLSAAPYGTLLGRPVMEIEQCQTLGTKGDAYLVDLGYYVLGEKGGVQSASSIHVAFTTDQSCFRFVMRVDGQPILNSALTPFKGSNTLSGFVCMETRS